MESGGIIMPTDITNISQEARTKAYFEETPFGNNVLAKPYNLSERTIREYKRTGRVPKRQKKLNKAIQRTGKRYAFKQKETIIRERILFKFEKRALEAERQASSVKGVARRVKLQEAAAEREAKRIASEKSLTELVGMADDLRTDDDWTEWLRNYEAVKGVLYS